MCLCLCCSPKTDMKHTYVYHSVIIILWRTRPRLVSSRDNNILLYCCVLAPNNNYMHYSSLRLLRWNMHSKRVQVNSRVFKGFQNSRFIRKRREMGKKVPNKNCSLKHQLQLCLYNFFCKCRSWEDILKKLWCWSLILSSVTSFDAKWISKDIVLRGSTPGFC